MQIRVETQGFTITPPIGARTHQQVGHALQRYAEHVMGVDVYLKDTNGPKGGEDKQVYVRVSLKHRAPVVITTTHGDLYRGIDLAAKRVRRAVRRSLGRSRLLVRHARRRSRGIGAWQTAEGNVY